MVELPPYKFFLHIVSYLVQHSSWGYPWNVFRSGSKCTSRLLVRASYLENLAPVLQQSHCLLSAPWLSLKLFLFPKALYGLGLRFLRDYPFPTIPAQELGLRGDALLTVLPIKDSCLVSTWKRAFSVVVLPLENIIPREMNLAPLLLVFRRQLKIDLFRTEYLFVYCLPKG